MRKAETKRKTKETEIVLSINIDGKGESEIETGIGFFDHMLTLFAMHGGFDLKIKCKGDLEVDGHHTVEDVGIALGEAFNKALGDKKGITRYGDKTVPMDEALNLAAVDISGRGYLNFDAFIPTEKIGEFDSELVEEFFAAFTRSAKITLHIVQMAGENSHHIAEGIFKAVARALRDAVKVQPEFKEILPSTKGVI